MLAGKPKPSFMQRTNTDIVGKMGNGFNVWVMSDSGGSVGSGFMARMDLGFSVVQREDLAGVTGLPR